MSLCTDCDFDDALDFTRCPACGSFNVGPLPRPEEADVKRNWTVDPFLVRASDMTSLPPSMFPTDTPFDVIGVQRRGVPLGSLLLLSGAPGGGKSHLARELACAWTLHRNAWVIYCSTEEPLVEVHRKIAEQSWKLEAHALHFSRGPFAAEMIADIGNPEQTLLVVIDSLQTCALGQRQEQLSLLSRGELKERTDAGAAGSVRRTLAVVEEARTLLHALPRMSVLLICHETKDEKVAGPRTVEHLVDVVMSLKVTKDESEDENVTTLSRVLHIGKNRIGESYIQVPV